MTTTRALEGYCGHNSMLFFRIAVDLGRRVRRVSLVRGCLQISKSPALESTPWCCSRLRSGTGWWLLGSGWCGGWFCSSSSALAGGGRRSTARGIRGASPADVFPLSSSSFAARSKPSREGASSGSIALALLWCWCQRWTGAVLGLASCKRSCAFFCIFLVVQGLLCKLVDSCPCTCFVCICICTVLCMFFI